MGILSAEEATGLSAFGRLSKAIFRGLRENRVHLFVDVSGEFWESLLAELLARNRPLQVLGASHNEAYIEVFVYGREARVYPSAVAHGFDYMEWRQ